VSQLIATVSDIQHCDSLHIVSFLCHGQTLTMMSLELASEVQVGTRVKLLVKPSHIAIAKGFSGEVSYANQLECTITSIDNGELLSSVHLRFADTLLESIITLNSSQRMDLDVGDSVVAFIKSSELSIGETIDD